MPLERMSPCGQDEDDHMKSPYATSKEQPDGYTGHPDMSIAYKGKNKMLLSACLPFLRKKKSSRKSGKRDEHIKEDSYGADC